MQLDVVNYDFKDLSNTKRQIGFLAQDVEELWPELVNENEDPNYGL